MSGEHKRLLAILPTRPEDYAPWGTVERWATDAAYPDCSSGCRHARWLEGDLGGDWCVCTNPASHRVGLLTFEHQGCQVYEGEPMCDRCDDPPEECICVERLLARPLPAVEAEARLLADVVDWRHANAGAQHLPESERAERFEAWRKARGRG